MKAMAAELLCLFLCEFGWHCVGVVVVGVCVGGAGVGGACVGCRWIWGG